MRGSCKIKLRIVSIVKTIHYGYLHAQFSIYYSKFIIPPFVIRHSSFEIGSFFVLFGQFPDRSKRGTYPLGGIYSRLSTFKFQLHIFYFAVLIDLFVQDLAFCSCHQPSRLPGLHVPRTRGKEIALKQSSDYVKGEVVILYFEAPELNEGFYNAWKINSAV